MGWLRLHRLRLGSLRIPCNRLFDRVVAERKSRMAHTQWYLRRIRYGGEIPGPYGICCFGRVPCFFRNTQGDPETMAVDYLVCYPCGYYLQPLVPEELNNVWKPCLSFVFRRSRLERRAFSELFCVLEEFWCRANISRLSSIALEYLCKTYAIRRGNESQRHPQFTFPPHLTLPVLEEKPANKHTSRI